MSKFVLHISTYVMDQHNFHEQRSADKTVTFKSLNVKRNENNNLTTSSPRGKEVTCPGERYSQYRALK